MNQFSTISSFILGASMIPFFWNVYITGAATKRVEVDDPWGFGASLEWATSCPPPRHNFTSLPRIRSERRPSTCTTRNWPASSNHRHRQPQRSATPTRGEQH